jgi:(E)-4-hydroxy-3-methyl-but-2-enyl pyrophosphate reductase
MEIRLADTCGFCLGVKRAIKKIESISNKNNLYVLGQLIHNPQAINNLKEQGVKFVDHLDDIATGTVVISAHGIADSIIELAKSRGLNIIDTTCLLVKNVHQITKRLESIGRKVIIFGDNKHIEVKGIAGNLNNPIIIDDSYNLNDLAENNYGLVSQTTREPKAFNNIAQKLKERFPNIIVKDTICAATKDRQRDAEELAKKSDLIIVIGGYNSSNTKKLKTVCEKFTKAYHIEYSNELKQEWFDGCNNIGVTAGASTPQSTIDSVIERIEKITKKRTSTPGGCSS